MIKFKYEMKYYEIDDYEQYRIFLRRYKNHESWKISSYGKIGSVWILKLVKRNGVKQCNKQN